MDARIVGLAAEKEILEDSREVVLLANAAGRPFVAIRSAIVPRDSFIVGAARPRADAFATNSAPPYSREQLKQPRAIEPRQDRSSSGPRGCASPNAPRASGAGRHAHPAPHSRKPNAKIGKARGHAAEDNRAAQFALLIRMAADVVEHVVAGERRPSGRNRKPTPPCEVTAIFSSMNLRHSGS